MSKRILITAGGTGGHLYPAMSLATQLRQEDANTQILFVGGGLGNNIYFERKAHSYQEVSCGKISLKTPLSALGGSLRILQGVFQSRSIMKKFRPDIVVGFGSYHTFPVLIAAKMCKVPILLHEANRIPGRVNRWFSPYAKMTGVHFPDTAHRLKGKAIEACLPLREGYRLGSMTREQAAAYFQLDPKKFTLLVFGGSQGAQSLNYLVRDAVLQLPLDTRRHLQILHFTGNAQLAKELSSTYFEYQIKAEVRQFEARMEMAWNAADLLISRSGVGTLAEQVEFEVPSILIPYPYAMDNHQESNADYMVDVVKGALKFSEKGLSAKILTEGIIRLLNDDHALYQEMKHALHDYKLSSHPKKLSNLVREMLQ